MGRHQKEFVEEIFHFFFQDRRRFKDRCRKRELLQLDESAETNEGDDICLITGERGIAVDTTTATMIPGSQATAKLVAFQISSGYDSYGKKNVEMLQYLKMPNLPIPQL